MNILLVNNDSNAYKVFLDKFYNIDRFEDRHQSFLYTMPRPVYDEVIVINLDDECFRGEGLSVILLASKWLKREGGYVKATMSSDLYMNQLSSNDPSTMFSLDWLKNKQYDVKTQDQTVAIKLKYTGHLY